jgi:predicted Zn-ribbon and HTH transcriptional regulator
MIDTTPKTCSECGWIFAVGEDETKCPRCVEEPICEATFEKWSKENPQKLIDFIEDKNNKFHQLTFAAEHAGHCKNSLESLIKLLDHEDAVVREGAIIGLDNYYHKFILKDLYKLLKAANRYEETESSPMNFMMI